MDDNTELAALTADIVAAYVSNNPLPPTNLPEVIKEVYASLANVANQAAGAAEEVNLIPAVSVRKSVTDDVITCLECGKKFKSLKRHIRTYHNVTPDEYRIRWKLPSDYPMVAPNYSQSRAQMAKQFGLGRKRRK